MLEKENAYYMTNQIEFKEKYLDKWLVITNESLWGVFDKISDAAKAVLQNKFNPGEFMIHRPADDDRILEIMGPIIQFKQHDEKKTPRKQLKITTTSSNPVKFQYAH